VNGECLELRAILEKKTGRALRPPRLVHPALASLIYSGGEAAARRGGEARRNLTSAGVTWVRVSILIYFFKIYLILLSIFLKNKQI
jgi:hypothetical protein